jgi:hypothetical protein
MCAQMPDANYECLKNKLLNEYKKKAVSWNGVTLARVLANLHLINSKM